MKIFLICPVRNVSEQDQRDIRDYVSWLEDSGDTVHWPSRDTNQNDPVGRDICLQNLSAIGRADEVHVWWNPESSGSLFDFGMAFALRKVIRAANNVQPTRGKSFTNLLLAVDPGTIPGTLPK